MENELLKIGAAYIRVSDERQDEYSPDSQLKKIREYAAKEGYIIPDEYVFYDDGISGKSVKKRDDFNRMIAIAKEKAHPFDRIYVWKFSRFARNQEESMVYKNLLRKRDVTVVSVSEPIPEGHFGTLIERIIEWMDEFYLINLGVEVTRGMTEKVSRGEPVVPPPLGYKMGEKTYIPDEESGNADIVREIFQRYADGEKQREIAISLGQRGVRTSRGNMPENRWVDYILHNPCYIGKIRWSLEGARAVSTRDYDNKNIMLSCNYSRGSCHTSHSVTMPKIEAALIEGLKQALGDKKFTINPKTPKKSAQTQIDFDKLIAVEERRLARAKEAYLAEIDTIEQYGQNKKEITDRIADLKARQSKEIFQEIDIDAFAKKVAGVVGFIQRDDVTDTAKNEALRTIIEKVVYEKAKGNLAIYFHDI